VSKNERYNPFPRPTLTGEDDAKGRPAARDPERIAVGIPLGKLIPRELVITPEIVMVSAPRTAAAERFRRLKTLLVHDAEEEPQVIVVTSPLPSEGKSLVSLNLALAFAADLKGEVLLIDADLRRPGINRWLKPAPKIGLKEILTGEADLEHGLLEIKSQRIVLLPAGVPAADPVPLVSGASAKDLLQLLRGRFKKIIIDTPPIVPFTDADIIGALSDGVIVVARSKKTPKPLLEQAIKSVTSARILGVVLNDVAHNLADRYRNYDGYYSEYYQREGES
jgi:capsular exopolysaccharide synthesis family protein